ncbi:MAG TPA: hypothetical protein VFR89_02405, partial [candidate division Zixibacteria bacterium]|nr:hypothetical protein [candidate division Zixibacteria bacterium]
SFGKPNQPKSAAGGRKVEGCRPDSEAGERPRQIQDVGQEIEPILASHLAQTKYRSWQKRLIGPSMLGFQDCWQPTSPYSVRSE